MLDFTRLKTDFETQGYLLLRQVVPVDRIRNMAAYVAEKAPGYAGQFRMPHGEFPTFGELIAQHVLPITHKFWRLGVPQALLGDDVWLRLPPSVRYIPPHTPEANAGAHQDGAVLAHEMKNFFTVWFPLAEITPAHGGLALYPDMPHNQVHETELHVPTNRPAVITGNAKPLTFEMSPGDALLFHPYMVHGGAPNTSDSHRLSFDVRYFNDVENRAKQSINLRTKEMKVGPKSEIR